MVQLLPADSSPDTLASSLILSGLSVSSPPAVLESYPQLSDSLNKMNMSQGQAYVVSATKPNHEVGASRLLSFAKPAAPVAPAVTAPAESVWHHREEEGVQGLFLWSQGGAGQWEGDQEEGFHQQLRQLLPGRCLQMRQLSLPRHASLQPWRQDTTI